MLWLSDPFSWEFRPKHTTSVFNFESLRGNETKKSSWGFEVIWQQWIGVSKEIHGGENTREEPWERWKVASG